MSAVAHHRVHPRRLAAVVTLLLAALVLTACETPVEGNDSRSATAGMPNLTQELQAQKWRLVWTDSSVATRVTNRVTLRFAGDEVFGQAPCNAYRGRFTTDIDNWTVTITDVSTTKKACAARVMRAEREYLRALVQVRDVEFSDGYFDVVIDNSTGDRLSYEAYDTYR